MDLSKMSKKDRQHLLERHNSHSDTTMNELRKKRGESEQLGKEARVPEVRCLLSAVV